MRHPSDIELDIRKICQVDKSSDKLYIYIKELAEAYMRTFRQVDTYRELDEISHEIASDLYQMIQDGYEIFAWRKYVRLMVKRYRQNYWSVNRSQVIDVSDVTDKDKFICEAYSASLNLSNMLSEEELLLLVSDAGKIFDEIVSDRIKYSRGTKKYLNVKTSVLLSFKFNELKLYEIYDKSDIEYVELVYKSSLKVFCDYLTLNLHGIKFLGIDEITQSLSELAFDALSED